jgi:hypothetical protein
VTPLIRIDELLLAGATVQCALVLASRRFRPKDWILPLFILVGGSAGSFGFLRLASPDLSAIADGAIIFYAMALMGCGLFVADYAPSSLNPTALLSLTITFWAVLLMGNLSRLWLLLLLPMTVVAVLFAVGYWSRSMGGRLLLQAWSLILAVILSADGVPARVATVLRSYRKEELAPSLTAFEIVVAGAQFFLLAQMAAGLAVLIDVDTWSAWDTPGRDERPRAAAVVGLVLQGAVFFWLRRSAGELQGDLLALATFAALAHGGMTGGDASNAIASPPDPVELVLSPEEQNIFADARDFLVRHRIALSLAAAAAVAALVFFTRSI